MVKTRILDHKLIQEVGRVRNPAHEQAVRLCDLRPGTSISVFWHSKLEKTVTLTTFPYLEVHYFENLKSQYSVSWVSNYWHKSSRLRERWIASLNLIDAGIVPDEIYDGFSPYRYALLAE